VYVVRAKREVEDGIDFIYNMLNHLCELLLLSSRIYMCFIIVLYCLVQKKRKCRSWRKEEGIEMSEISRRVGRSV